MSPGRMGLEQVELGAAATLGNGRLRQPETVLVTSRGRLLVSDGGEAAVCEVRADGSVAAHGSCPGMVTGLAEAADGTILYAAFEEGALRRLDLESGRESVVLDEVGDMPLTWPNHPLVDPIGAVWLSCSSAEADRRRSIIGALDDGYLVRLGPDGRASIATGGLQFPNCLALDGHRLYVVCSAMSEVRCFDIGIDGALSAAGRYGPQLGGREPGECSTSFDTFRDDEALRMRWALADGCAFDGEGNLWVTLMTANRIVAITPEQRVVTIMDDPAGTILRAPTSIAWGGDDHRDLYIGSLTADYVVTARSPVPGPALDARRRGPGAGIDTQTVRP